MYQSSEQLFPMAFQEYDQMITTVGQKIANAADK